MAVMAAVLEKRIVLNIDRAPPRFERFTYPFGLWTVQRAGRTRRPAL
jgi:hypothetical protein